MMEFTQPILQIRVSQYKNVDYNNKKPRVSLWYMFTLTYVGGSNILSPLRVEVYSPTHMVSHDLAQLNGTGFKFDMAYPFQFVPDIVKKAFRKSVQPRRIVSWGQFALGNHPQVKKDFYRALLNALNEEVV